MQVRLKDVQVRLKDADLGIQSSKMTIDENQIRVCLHHHLKPITSSLVTPSLTLVIEEIVISTSKSKSSFKHNISIKHNKRNYY